MLEIRSAADRGIADFGWLKSRHTFSFGHYHDPKQEGFSDLLVINDDRVTPGRGFGTHPHRDMEIFSYVLDGALEHKDSMGTGSVIRPGDVQMMSAGTGVRHSEFNHDAKEPVHFLQIWIMPERQGVEPSYEEKRFDEASKRGQLRLIVSPDGRDGSLRMNQDAYLYASILAAGDKLALELAQGRLGYVHVARGSVTVNGTVLDAGDALRLKDVVSIELEGGGDAEVLVFDLPR